MENYKTTKTIRFKLIEECAEGISAIRRDLSVIEAKGKEFSLAEFVSALSDYIINAQDYLFYDRPDDTLAFKSKIVIKNEWLRRYAPQEYAEIGEKRRAAEAANKARGNHKGSRREQITAEYDEALPSKVEDAFDAVNEIYESLAEDAGLEQNERAKRARAGLLLRRLAGRNTLPLLMDFIENSVDKNETDDLSVRLKKDAGKLRAALTAGLNAFLPEQSSGLTAAKASFNFYTINKKPVDYTQEKKKLENRLKIDLRDGEASLKSYFKGIHKKYDEKNIPLAWIYSDVKTDVDGGKTLLIGDAPTLDVKEAVSLRQILKNIKSKQKAEFSEMMQAKKSYESLKSSNLYLLKDITPEQFEKYEKKTKELEDKATKLSNQGLSADQKKKLTSEKNTIAKDRGDIMKDTFATWKAFADLYRVVSQKHGKILAQLKGMEREEAESQLLKYWAVAVEKDGKHKIALVPKGENGADKCKQWLDGLKKSGKTGASGGAGAKLYWFESLTFRSLQKLCFAHAENGSSSFNRAISRLLPKDARGNTQNGLFAFAGDEEKIIEFFKNVLKEPYTRAQLDIPWGRIDSEIIAQKIDKLDDFKVALEKICYRRYAVCGQPAIEKLRSFGAQIFDITSLDLEHEDNVKDKAEKYSLIDKRHTQIWKRFWTNENEAGEFETRLNPEIAVSYRKPKPSRVSKYGENSKEYDPNKRNRYLREQFTLVTTVSEHCDHPEKILSFATEDEFKKMLGDFNKKFKKEDIKFALGIDNGEVELSTLGVYLPEFGKTMPREILGELQNIGKYGFDVFEITDLNYKEADCNGKERKIVLNPSYFLIKENYMRTFNKSEQEYEEMRAKLFAQRRVLSLDLTTAKVIRGHIVTNGDVCGLFNLWMKHAQRNVFAMNDHTKKETAKSIRLRSNDELTEMEKNKFAEYVSDNKKLKKLSAPQKERYLKWIFEDRDGNNFTDDEKKTFGDCQKKKGNYSSHIIFASRFEGDELQSVTPIFECRHVFKKRAEFDSIKSEAEIKSEIDNYNTNRTSHNISNEELDLKMVNVKKALVANAVGVIDHLYNQYKRRFKGEGLIVKEGFDTRKVEEDIEKFSGNIYRILERCLYRKFQNYGLVPPIKSLMTVRNESVKKEDTILRLGNIAFVDPSGTSQKCPACGARLNHTETCPKNCGFKSGGIMHSNDGIAGFNIAKRGFENFGKETL